MLGSRGSASVLRDAIGDRKLPLSRCCAVSQTSQPGKGQLGLKLTEGHFGTRVALFRVVGSLRQVLPNLFGAAIEMLELFKKRRTTVEVVTASVTRDAKKWGLGKRWRKHAPATETVAGGVLVWQMVWLELWPGCGWCSTNGSGREVQVGQLAILPTFLSTTFCASRGRKDSTTSFLRRLS